MKRLFKLIFIIPLFFSIQGSIAQIVKKYGWLQVKGTHLCSQAGKEVSLRGMSFGWHNFRPRFYNADVVKWLHEDWHCTVLRAAMGIELPGGYKDDSANAISKVEAVVDAAIKEGIYIIIDWHSYNLNLKEAKPFFEWASKKYGRYPNVLFEIVNEPEEVTWQQVKEYAEAIIPIIRKNAPRNVIIVGCPHWDLDLDKPAADPIRGYKNLMQSMHYYAATHNDTLRHRADSAIQKGVAIFITESAGMYADGNGALNMPEWKRFINWSEAHKISWVTYSVSDKDESCSVLQTSAASDGHWKESDLKQSGIEARNFLRQYNKQY